MKPNLFQYATKELSQDAFLCWFISWSNLDLKEINPELHRQSKYFLSSILKKSALELPEKYEVEIKTQYEKIDILMLITSKEENIVFMIEDKVSSSEHNNQLERYKKIIGKKFKKYIPVLTYIKSDLVFKSELKKVTESGYHLIDINEFYHLIANEYVENDIFNDFKAHLKGKVKGYNIYHPCKQWGNSHWHSFAREVNCHFPDSRSGSYHLGSTWWVIILKEKLDKIKNIDISIEITNRKKLMIKIHSKEGILNKEIQKGILKNILPSVEKQGAIKSKNIRGIKNRAIIEFPNFLKLDEDGLIDLKATLNFIKIIKTSFEKHLLSLRTIKTN